MSEPTLAQIQRDLQYGERRRHNDAVMQTAVIAGTIAIQHQQAMAQQQYQFEWNNHVQAAIAQGSTLPQAQAMATAHMQQVGAQRARLGLAHGARDCPQLS